MTLDFYNKATVQINKMSFLLKLIRKIIQLILLTLLTVPLEALCSFKYKAGLLEFYLAAITVTLLKESAQKEPSI